MNNSTGFDRASPLFCKISVEETSLVAFRKELLLYDFRVFGLVDVSQ